MFNWIKNNDTKSPQKFSGLRTEHEWTNFVSMNECDQLNSFGRYRKRIMYHIVSHLAMHCIKDYEINLPIKFIEKTFNIRTKYNITIN